MFALARLFELFMIGEIDDVDFNESISTSDDFVAITVTDSALAVVG